MNINVRLNQKKTGTRIIRAASVLLISVVVLYASVCLCLYFLQDRLIFFPQKLSAEALAAADASAGAESVELTMQDGTRIRGWLVKSESPEPGLLIYFGGNAEEVSRLTGKAGIFRDWDVALMNYRGYGRSEGTPDESVMFSDSLEIYDYFSKRAGAGSSIVVMGRSIGTGVAAYLAENRKTSAVILVTPYDTLTSVVQEKVPLFPAGLLLKYRFDTLGRAPKITAPLLIVTGTDDTTIPVWHSSKVAEQWGGPVTQVELPGDHNSISQLEAYWEAIADFLAGRHQ